MTLQDFIKNSYGIDEYDVWDGDNLYISNDIVNTIPEDVKNKKIVSFNFKTDYDEIVCSIELEE